MKMQTLHDKIFTKRKAIFDGSECIASEIPNWKKSRNLNESLNPIRQIINLKIL